MLCFIDSSAQLAVTGLHSLCHSSTATGAVWSSVGPSGAEASMHVQVSACQRNWQAYGGAQHPWFGCLGVRCVAVWCAPVACRVCMAVCMNHRRLCSAVVHNSRCSMLVCAAVHVPAQQRVCLVIRLVCIPHCRGPAAFTGCRVAFGCSSQLFWQGLFYLAAQQRPAAGPWHPKTLELWLEEMCTDCGHSLCVACGQCLRRG